MNQLRAIRNKKQINKFNAAELLGISLKSLYNYEHGKTIPSDVLIKMSKLYDCSVDYLLGLTDYSVITVTKKDGEAVAVITKSKIIEHKDFNVILSTD